MRKVYHLSSCDTCQRIIKELQPLNSFEFQDIKKEALRHDQLSEMKEMAGSYAVSYTHLTLPTTPYV